MTKAKSAKARTAREKNTVRAMVALYCRHNHRAMTLPCADCCRLVEYSYERIDNCPFIDDKPTCLNCTVHCYEESMRNEIRSVMRYSGPRMIYHHPLLSILHLADGRRKRGRKV